MPTNPYELSKQELLSEFARACAHVGVSGSGIVIDLAAEIHRQNMSYLYGAVLARLDQAVPPVKSGAKVKPNKKEVRPNGESWRINPSPRQLPKNLTVRIVYYRGENKWEYEFAEEIEGKTAYKDGEYDQDGSREWLVPLRFNAEDFDLVEEAMRAPA
jgi:hypothetical protein